MNKELRDNLLKSLNQQIKDCLSSFLEEHLELLSDISRRTPENWEEVLGRQYAVKTLRDIFKFLNPDKKKNSDKSSYS